MRTFLGLLNLQKKLCPYFDVIYLQSVISDKVPIISHIFINNQLMFPIASKHGTYISSNKDKS
jgi:hypothetical protein